MKSTGPWSSSATPCCPHRLERRRRFLQGRVHFSRSSTRATPSTSRSTWTSPCARPAFFTTSVPHHHAGVASGVGYRSTRARRCRRAGHRALDRRRDPGHHRHQGAHRPVRRHGAGAGTAPRPWPSSTLRHGNLLDASANFLALMGYGFEEAIGQQHALFCRPEPLRSGDAFWQRLAQGNSRRANSSAGQRAGEVWVHATYNPIRDADDKVCRSSVGHRLVPATRHGAGSARRQSAPGRPPPRQHLPGQHEPRNPYAHERHHRLAGAARHARRTPSSGVAWAPCSAARSDCCACSTTSWIRPSWTKGAVRWRVPTSRCAACVRPDARLAAHRRGARKTCRCKCWTG